MRIMRSISSFRAWLSGLNTLSLGGALIDRSVSVPRGRNLNFKQRGSAAQSGARGGSLVISLM